MAELMRRGFSSFPIKLALLLIAISIDWVVGRLVVRSTAKSADQPSSISVSPTTLLHDRQRQSGPRLRGTLSRKLAQTVQWANTVSLTNPESALAAWRSLPTETLRQSGQLILQNRLKSENPSLALIYSEELGGKEVFTELSLQELVNAVRLNPGDSGTWIPLLIETNPIQAFSLEMELGALNRKRMGDIISNIAKQHGIQSAVERVEQLQNRGLRRAGTMEVIKLWINQDTKGALEWVRSFPKGIFRDKQLYQCAHTSSQLTPNETAELLSEVENPQFKSSLLGIAAGKLVDAQPEQAFELLSTTPGIPDRSRLTQAGNVTQRLAQTNPAKALKLFDAFGQEQDYSQSFVFENNRLRIYRVIFAGWATTAPSDAKAHLETIMDPQIQEAAQEALARALSP